MKKQLIIVSLLSLATAQLFPASTVFTGFGNMQKMVASRTKSPVITNVAATLLILWTVQNPRNFTSTPQALPSSISNEQLKKPEGYNKAVKFLIATTVGLGVFAVVYRGYNNYYRK